MVYGGTLVENDVVIDTVLGPIDRGVACSLSGFSDPDGLDRLIDIVPPSGEENVLIRIGTPRPLFRSRRSFLSHPVGSAYNPLTLDDGLTLTSFDGRGAAAAPNASNTIVLFSEGFSVLEARSRLEVTPPVPALYIELEVHVDGTSGSGYEVFAIMTDGVEGARHPLPVGRSTIHLRGSNSAAVFRAVLRRTHSNPFAPTARLVATARRGPRVHGRASLRCRRAAGWLVSYP